ncbi:unnamed protein product [Cunninghamella blakesleeana]
MSRSSLSDISKDTSTNNNNNDKISNSDKNKENITTTSSSYNNNNNNNKQRQIPTSVIITNESTPLLSQYDTQIHETIMALSLNKTDPLQRRKEIIGLILLILSALSLTAMSAYVKRCNQYSIGLFTIVFSRLVIQLNLSLIACAFLKINPLGKHGIRLWLLQRAFIVSIGLTLFFYSLTMLSLFTATVLFFLGPIFVTILSAIVFEENFNNTEVLYTILSIVGILFVTKPGLIFTYNDNNNTISLLNYTISSTNHFITQFGIGSALLGALTSAMSFITVRKIGKGVHFLVHSVYFGAVSSLISPLCFFLFQESLLPSSDINWDIMQNLVFLGLFAFIGQCSLNQG